MVALDLTEQVQTLLDARRELEQSVEEAATTIKESRHQLKIIEKGIAYFAELDPTIAGSTHVKVSKRGGRSGIPRTQRTDDEKRALVRQGIKMYKTGEYVSWGAVGEELGISDSLLRRWAYKLEIPWP